MITNLRHTLKPLLFSFIVFMTMLIRMPFTRSMLIAKMCMRRRCESAGTTLSWYGMRGRCESAGTTLSWYGTEIPFRWCHSGFLKSTRHRKRHPLLLSLHETIRRPGPAVGSWKSNKALNPGSCTCWGEARWAWTEKSWTRSCKIQHQVSICWTGGLYLEVIYVIVYIYIYMISLWTILIWP